MAFPSLKVTIFHFGPYYVKSDFIFCGSEKPDLDYFVEAFVNELVTLRNDGLNVNNRIIQIQVGAFCCDTPARAFVNNTKSHNGYSGCDKCVDKRVHFNHRMLFLKLDAPLRTDQNFQNEADKIHHKVY